MLICLATHKANPPRTGSDLVKSKNKDFDELALRYKQADGVSKRDLEADLKKTVQQLFEVGGELRNVQFGGYRS